MANKGKGGAEAVEGEHYSDQGGRAGRQEHDGSTAPAALGGGPSLPWLVLFAGSLHRAYVESGLGAQSCTADCWSAPSTTADHSSPPPPATSTRQFRATTPPPSSRTATPGPASSSRRFSPTRMARASASGTRASVQTGRTHDDDGDSLPLASSILAVESDFLTLGVYTGSILTEATTETVTNELGDELGSPLTPETYPDMILTKEDNEEGIDPGMILTEAAAGEYIRQPPLLRGCMEGLPQELLIMIARAVLKVSIHDAISMKLACKSWNAAFEVLGPFLVVTRNDPASPAVTMFKIASQDDDQLALVPVDCLYPPPAHTSCWGSSKGLLALRSMTDNSVILHCPTCGFREPLPNLPVNYDPKGVFLEAHNFTISLMTENTDPPVDDEGVVLDTTFMFLKQVLIDVDNGQANVEDEQLIWYWDVYPGADHLTPVRTVNFTQNATFSAATAGNIFILDRADRLLNQPFVTVNLQDTLALDNWTGTWMYHGQHIFVIGQLAYLCILTRSTVDLNDVGTVCFLIENNPGSELTFVEVNSFGPYSVYLGSNHPLVLVAIDGVPGRSPNTIYIEDNDGIIRNRRVLAINIETQAVEAILFPDDFQFGPLDFIASAWVAPNSENCHNW